MKIALVFYGQPRHVKENFNSFQQNILDGNDVDVFGHTWDCNDITDIGYYDFKKIKVEPQNNFEDYYIGKTGLPKFQNNAPMWYSTQGGCDVLKEYVDETNTHYDFVVRARYDIFLRYKIDFTKLDKDLIYVSEQAWPGSHMWDDSWGISSYENYVKIYSDLYTNYYNKHLHSQFIDRSEQNFWEHINEKGLQDKIKRERMIDFALFRDRN
jgi:hypothetical protein